jgi:hypothetical protein
MRLITCREGCCDKIYSSLIIPLQIPSQTHDIDFVRKTYFPDKLFFIKVMKHKFSIVFKET